MSPSDSQKANDLTQNIQHKQNSLEQYEDAHTLVTQTQETLHEMEQAGKQLIRLKSIHSFSEETVWLERTLQKNTQALFLQLEEDCHALKKKQYHTEDKLLQLKKKQTS